MVVWMRGLQEPPPVENVTANQVLMHIMARERESELAKIDYVVQSSFLTGTTADSKDRLEAQMRIIMNLRNAAADAVHHDAYNVEYQKKVKIERQKQLEADAATLQRVSKL